MNTELIDLKNLQELDDQLKAGRQAAALAVTQKSEAEQRLRGFEAKLARVEASLAEMRRRHRELEAEVSDLSLKRDKNQNRQSAVKTNNEFAALAKEAEFLAARINTVEDEILELLDSLEKAEVEKADLDIVLSEEAGLYAQTAAAIEESVRSGSERAAALTAQRRRLAEGLSPARLSQYDEIAKIRAGRAVAAAAAGMCQACSLSFPPQLFNDLQRNEKIQTCPNCGRILYWRDHPDFAGQSPAPTDALASYPQ